MFYVREGLPDSELNPLVFSLGHPLISRLIFEVVYNGIMVYRTGWVAKGLEIGIDCHTGNVSQGLRLQCTNIDADWLSGL